MQDVRADLFVADPGNLGGWALADALQVPKAILQVPGFHPPMVASALCNSSACFGSMVDSGSNNVDISSCTISHSVAQHSTA